LKGLFEKASCFLKRPFIRNVAIVASGTAAAQLIAVAFSPLITRIFGPEAFGLLGVFKALVATLAPIAALTYPIAIVLPKKDSEAIELMKLSFSIALIVFVIVAIAFWVGGYPLLKLLDSEMIAPYVMLIPLSILFAACAQIAQQWLIRKKQYGITAKVSVLQALLLNSAKAGFGLFNPTGKLLIELATAGHIINAVMFWVGIKRSGGLVNSPATSENYSGKTLKELAFQYYDFPLFRAPQVFLNTVSQSLPVLMLASYFGPASAGFYSIGRTVLGMPSQLISRSVGDVFYPRVAEAVHKGENISRLIINATVALAIIGFLPFAVVVAFGPWVFSFVFGAEWVKAGEYARWVAFLMFFSFINRPSINAIPALSFQGFFLFYETIGIVIRTLSLVAGAVIFNDDLIAIVIFSISGVLLNILLIVTTIYRAKRSE